MSNPFEFFNDSEEEDKPTLVKTQDKQKRSNPSPTQHMQTNEPSKNNRRKTKKKQQKSPKLHPPMKHFPAKPKSLTTTDTWKGKKE